MNILEIVDLEVTFSRHQTDNFPVQYKRKKVKKQTIIALQACADVQCEHKHTCELLIY